MAIPLNTRWLDRLGATVSLGCGLHCAMTSLVLILNPALWLRLAWQGNTLRWLFWLEIGLAITAVIVAIAAFGLGWWTHRRVLPLLLAIPGLIAILLGLVSGLHDQRFIGTGLAVAGGCLMVIAHWKNMRARDACPA